MTLDDAIDHCKEVASKEDGGCKVACAEDHRQLAEWLVELKLLRNENMKLRMFAQDACTVLRSHYDSEWFDGTVFAERMRNLGIEVFR